MDRTQNKKSKKSKVILLCVIATVLVAAIVGGVVAIVTLSRRSPVIMKCEGQKIRVNFYEFMLSRMKGELYKAKYDVESDDFWEQKVEGSDKTYEQYYNEAILDTCKEYLASLVIFEELVKNGEITGLPEDYYAQIEESIQLYIDLSYVGNGSEKRFNRILSDYGIDVDALREIYIMEAKAQYVQEYIYGGSDATKIGNNVKEDYYKENYYRFKHILVGNFYYKYLLDDLGNRIYFEGDTGYALYDYENGEKRDDDGDGMYNRDADGVVIAYNKDTGEYLYDTENGVTRFVNDENGVAKKFYYTDAEMIERRALANQLCNIEQGDFKSFETKGADEAVNTDYSNAFTLTSGIYMSDIEKSAYEGYMTEILEKVKTMEVGEIAMIEGDDGYHVIMKYELDDGAFGESANKKWFQRFNSSLVSKLYLEKCRSMFDGIKILEDNLKKARSIKDIGINTDY